MYATALDSCLGWHGGKAAGLHVAAGDGTGARIPAPRRPADGPMPESLTDHGVSQVLDHRPEAVGAARHTAQAVLENGHIDAEAADAVVLVVSELVTNAVEHAEPPLALHLHHELPGSRLFVSVTDGGSAPHHGPWTASCADDEHGRGLTIIGALADTHGVRTHPHGATHWARLTTTP